jgi:hypothetical protein
MEPLPFSTGSIVGLLRASTIKDKVAADWDGRSSTTGGNQHASQQSDRASTITRNASNLFSTRQHSFRAFRGKDQAMEIEGTTFGSITIDGKTYEHDVIIRLSWEVVKRKKRLSEK